MPLASVLARQSSGKTTALRAMSNWASYRQPVPGNLQEEKPFTFQFLGIFLVYNKTLYENWIMYYRSGPVA